MKPSPDRFLFAFSGGLVSSLALAKLAERRKAQVITLTLDVGQDEALDDVKARALSIGAVRAHVLDVREAFARDVLRPVLAADAWQARRSCALYLHFPVVAKHAVEIARVEGIGTIAHGASGLTAAVLDRLISSIDPSLKILAPLRDAGLTAPAALAAALDRGVPVPSGAGDALEVRRHLWMRSVAWQSLDDSGHEPSEDAFAITKSAGQAPDVGADVEIEFVKGAPVKLNGTTMFPGELIQTLDAIAGAHGVGRLDTISGEERVAIRRTYEAPAAFVMEVAHRDLRALVTASDLTETAASLAVRYADVVSSGGWFTQTRTALDAFFGAVEESVTGTIVVRLFKGGATVVSRRSPFARRGALATAASSVLN